MPCQSALDLVQRIHDSRGDIIAKAKKKRRGFVQRRVRDSVQVQTVRTILAMNEEIYRNYCRDAPLRNDKGIEQYGTGYVHLQTLPLTRGVGIPTVIPEKKREQDAWYTIREAQAESDFLRIRSLENGGGEERIPTKYLSNIWTPRSRLVELTRLWNKRMKEAAEIKEEFLSRMEKEEKKKKKIPSIDNENPEEHGPVILSTDVHAVSEKEKRRKRRGRGCQGRKLGGNQNLTKSVRRRERIKS